MIEALTTNPVISPSLFMHNTAFDTYNVVRSYQPGGRFCGELHPRNHLYSNCARKSIIGKTFSQTGLTTMAFPNIITAFLGDGVRRNRFHPS